MWIPRSIPNFTDHGILHTVNVIKNISKLDNYTKLSEREKFILVLAAILHDIGCIIDRDLHNFHTVELLNRPEYSDFIDELTEDEALSLIQVILAHSKNYNLEIIIETLAEDIRLDLICPLFRLSDALDISTSRIQGVLFSILTDYNKLSEKSKKIWESHVAISDISVEGNKIIVETRDLFKNEYCLNDLLTEIVPINVHLLKNGYTKIEVIPRYKGSDAEELTEENLNLPNAYQPHK